MARLRPAQSCRVNFILYGNEPKEIPAHAGSDNAGQAVHWPRRFPAVLTAALLPAGSHL